MLKKLLLAVMAMTLSMSLIGCAEDAADTNTSTGGTVTPTASNLKDVLGTYDVTTFEITQSNLDETVTYTDQSGSYSTVSITGSDTPLLKITLGGTNIDTKSQYVQYTGKFNLTLQTIDGTTTDLSTIAKTGMGGFYTGRGASTDAPNTTDVSGLQTVSVTPDGKNIKVTIESKVKYPSTATALQEGTGPTVTIVFTAEGK